MENTISLYVAPYIADWLVHHFGEPVRFPNGSPENVMLRYYTSKRAPEQVEHPRHTRPVRIILPDHPYKRAQYYCHLSDKNRGKFCRMLSELFKAQLWTDNVRLLTSRTEIKDGLICWCRKNGVGTQHLDTVTKIFYRARLRYQRAGLAEL